MQANANRPEASNAFEMERWMPRILPQQFIALVREPAYVLRQRTITLPEPRVGTVPHRSVQHPSRKSSSASSASASRRPLTISASMRRSHASASNSANHARNAASSAAGSPCTASSISFTPLTSSSLTADDSPEQAGAVCLAGCYHLQQETRRHSVVQRFGQTAIAPCNVEAITPHMPASRQVTSGLRHSDIAPNNFLQPPERRGAIDEDRSASHSGPLL
jgi:hypothetical protein